ncbi:two-partner secretion domain-containing protein [Pseudomonas muyukensis]|uniref:Hemagglutinin repeat-containing protein n=1 Tax=Pseudomonas muyukensis TaxID=2842357 RepID=A0ABX8M8N6_9PSED|nr:hemagglutinin repeat-containing protein [Pseudomonas muyukensis]QXH34828.1 hemagglutinin repeat-containing protein [Pseudomonas muyukensis]
MPPTFSLPPAARPDTLRKAILVALLGTTQAQAALQATEGATGTPFIDHGHGVPVIQITAPNGQGLSHNRFTDYNVGVQGLVLNNALEAGQSQLAGQLSGNPQFQGTAATTILNEVVSHKASLIEGPQEIFGQRADYLLANPNGITVNGGRFINTATASLVVGTPVLQDDKLHHLSTEQATGSLQIQARNAIDNGLHNLDGALHLIAPRLDSTGHLAAKDDLQIVVGRNHVDSSTAQTLHTVQPETARIDAQLLGAMSAGRIHLKSTTLGAGVRMAPTWVTSNSDITLDSAGALTIAGEPDRPVYLDAQDGALRLTSTDDLQLTSVGGRAQHISIDSGHKLSVAGSVLDRRQAPGRDHPPAAVEPLERYQVNQLRSTGDISLKSVADMELTAAQLLAEGTLRLQSEGAVQIVAGRHDQRSESPLGEQHQVHTRQTATGSRLLSKNMEIEATDALIVRGSLLDSLEALTAKAETVTLEHQPLLEGPVGAFDTHHDAPYTWSSTPSAVRARNLAIHGGQIRIAGSHLTSYGDTHLETSTGPLLLESVATLSRSSQFTPGKTLFGKSIGHQTTQTTHTQAHHSTVQSQGSLTLQSAGELRVHGADLKANRDLRLQANGALTLDSSTSSLKSSHSILDPGFTAGIRQTLDPQDGKPGSRQWELYAGVERPEQTISKTEITQNPSTVEGSTVSLHSGVLVQANGARIIAGNGDLDVKGPTVSLGAAYHEREGELHLSNLGTGLALSAGVERLGNAWEGRRENQMSHARQRTALGSELLASGNITIASDTLLTQASAIKAGAALQIDTGNIANRTAQEVVERSSLIDKWRASIGASLEYFGLTKPVLEVIDGKPADRFQQASIEEALSPPSVGVDATWRMKNRLDFERDTRAKASELSGATIKVNAAVIDDQGTAWRASTGTLDITARQHHQLAARHSSERNVTNLDASADLRVDTVTGKDVGIRIAGKGSALDSLKSTSTAVASSLEGQAGVALTLEGDGLYEGSRIVATDGKVMIRSTGNLAFTAAADSSGSSDAVQTGSGRIKLSSKPGEQGGEVRGYLDLSKKYNTATTAKVAQIDAKDEVLINSRGEQSHQGTRIDSEQAISLYSGGRLAITEARHAQQADGNRHDGGFELLAKLGATQGGGLGGHLGQGSLAENDSQAVGAILNGAGNLTLSSRAQDDQALHLRGLQASSAHLELHAINGGMLIEASDNRELHDSLDVTGGLGLLSTTGKTDTRGVFARAKVELDRRDNQMWNASTLKANRIDLFSNGDTRLEGVSLHADSIDANVGGDLRLASRQDDVDTLVVKTDLGASHEKNPQGFLTAINALGGRWGKDAKEQLGNLPQQALHGTLMIDVQREVRDNVAHQAVIAASNGMKLNVGGSVQLIGARLESSEGDVTLGTSPLSTETLAGSNFHRAVSVDLTNHLPELALMVASNAQEQPAAKGQSPLDLLLFKTSGHDRDAQWSSHVKGQTDTLADAI